ncbi:MAG: TauD/TfdA family dioxygenase [Aliidongia sp.]
MSYLPQPPKMSLLYALEVPPAGGETGFTSMYGAYDALPAALKARAESLQIKHDGTYNSGGYLRQGVTATDDPRTSPGAVHPLVCTHPETGRRNLYLGRRRNAYLIGLPLEESEHCYDELWHYATQPNLSWYNAWRVGDLVLWDNRCTMHRPQRLLGREPPHHASHPGPRPGAAGGLTASSSRSAEDRTDGDKTRRCEQAAVRALPALSDPLCRPGEHFDRSAADPQGYGA